MVSTRLVRVRHVNAAVALAAAALACSAPATHLDSKLGASSKTVLRDERHQGGVGESCIATGVETCFDARDDNCNGLFDEGCGLPDGPLQILVAWDSPAADVDIEVFDPNGEPALVGKLTSLGLTKDRDCPGEPNECGGQNIEVVYLEGDRVPDGRYAVTLRLERADPVGKEVTLRLGGHIGNEPIIGSWTLSAESPEYRFEIERILLGVGARNVQQ